MLVNTLIITVLIIVTTGLHAGGMIIAVRISRIKLDRRVMKRYFNPIYIPWFRISGIILLMFVVALAEVALWAGAYLMLGAFSSLEPAIYFSMVTFTTLGYGEIVLDPNWRLLASCEAAIGIIMFGWTTAIVIAAVQEFYFKQQVIPDVDPLLGEDLSEVTPSKRDPD